MFLSRAVDGTLQESIYLDTFFILNFLNFDVCLPTNLIINDQWTAPRILFTHQLLTLLKALAVGHSLGTVKFLEVLLPALLLRCPGVTALLMRAGHCG